MEELPVNEALTYPVHVNSISVPNDTALKRAYDIYKPSTQTIQLLSEQGRSVYAEAFIENKNLGTLADLCVRVLARSFGPQPLPIVASNPCLLQEHYDALDVDLPLEKCYSITEERFWKRVVLAKHKDKTLAVKNNVNWKELGVSLKYVELVESCPAEYWPEEEMKDLALKVKDFVSEMHIKRLQSLKERSFAKYFHSQSESTSEEEEGEESSESLLSSSSEEVIETSAIEQEDKTESQLELEKEMVNKKAQMKKERLELRESKRKAREAKEAKRKEREARRATKEPPPPKKSSKKIPDNVFEIELSESSDDGEDRIIDKRNKALLLKHIKKYNYPAKDCHHIDLGFVQYFTNLQIFVIEFWGPLQNRNYQIRHMNFSLDDIERLAGGLQHLSKLHTFRLRNSRMDAEKLLTLCRALGFLPHLETLDFGFDNLGDDSASAFEELFQTTKTVCNLELESNGLGEQVLGQIGRSLKNYKAKDMTYLGLARNPITDKALHAFVSEIIGTNHIVELNIRGAKFITDMGLCCCLANELLGQHTPLTKLDICAIKIPPLAANELIKSLAKNEKLLVFYCVGCDLDEELEVDINVLLQRNKYIAENYYVGDSTITNEEIEKWVNRTRNPILLKVLAEREKQRECLKKRSLESIPSSVSHSLPTTPQTSLQFIPKMHEEHLNEYTSAETADSAGQLPQRFHYPANEFNEEEFLQHVSQPGPKERYYYFKMCKEKFAIKDNVKNISMI
ncbi:LOW QUALITY PROTEIN: uncharacterized protein LOC119613230 [Lucilia sericata]|uniref:LOW QUALITY PROTEIN: uncharacterized protein LOC119613230 n=1 Tax=Lucilia sericata TaxID=13632 RepID=UPI0018A827B2|nr:LOW QUALITY PROTEIN: uncharacterized protein LOC119613230 [Lucilia sericata]